MDREPFVIRHALPADGPAILGCLRFAFEPYRAAYTRDAFADTVLSDLTIGRRLETMTVLVALSPGLGGRVAGTVGGHAAGDEGHIRGMAVHPDREGGGLGRALLSSIEAQLRARGCSRVTLDTTRPLTRAIAFYARHGYRPTGVVRDFHGMELLEYAKTLSGR